MEQAIEQRSQQSRRSAVSVDEAAARLGCERKTIYGAIRAGEIPHIRIGRRLLIPIGFFDKLERAK
jgi:excisionase family DNA binding protein